MQIVAVETYPVRVPLKPERHMITALGEHTVSKYLLVRVLTDTGIEGAGEATVSPLWSGETVWGARALVDRLFAPALLGMEPGDVGAVAQRLDRIATHNWFAKSAIEMACWDIRGKAAGKPVYELLGGAVRPLTIRSRFSMGAYGPERAARRARELVAAGFTTLKVKVGTDPARDVERVRTVREAAGPGPNLVIDANCGWNAPTAIACVGELADCRVGVVEQPTPDGDYAALAQVRRAIEPEVMADDICFNLVHAQELLRNECCDVISLYPGKNGGIGKSLAIAEFAAAHGVACSIGSNLELDVATAAMGHLIIACRNMQVEKYPGDILGPDYHEFSIARQPIPIEGPLTTIPGRPGLGVEVDWDVVRAHPCD